MVSFFFFWSFSRTLFDGFDTFFSASSFTRVSLSDGGIYVCTARNDAGTVTATAHVIVQSPPVVTVTPKSGTLQVKEGDLVRLECRGTGVPQVTLKWKKLHQEGPEE